MKGAREVVTFSAVHTHAFWLTHQEAASFPTNSVPRNFPSTAEFSSGHEGSEKERERQALRQTHCPRRQKREGDWPALNKAASPLLST